MTLEVFTFGETMGLIRGDEVNSLSQLHTARISTGGSESNLAIGLARLGLETTWFSRVGNDGFGQRIIRDLKSEGVKVIAKIDPLNSTGLMVKTSPRSGMTEVEYYRRSSAASKIDSSDFDSFDFANFVLVHLTGITPALSRSCLEAWFSVAKRAKASNCLVSFDVNYRSKLWSKSEARKVFKRMASLCDVLIAGVDEAQILLNVRDSNAGILGRRIQKLGPRLVVIKQAAVGATAIALNCEHFEPAIHVDAVDTVGAGDAFTATFLATYLASKDPIAAIKRAVIAGGLACSHPGDWQGMPTSFEIEKFESRDPVSR